MKKIIYFTCIIALLFSCKEETAITEEINIESPVTISIKINEASIEYTIVDYQSSNIDKTGVCWSQKTNPTIDDSSLTVVLDNGYGKIQANNLEENTTYYVKAYAMSDGVYTYSKQIEFTTLSLLAVTPSFGNIVFDNINTIGTDISSTISDNKGYDIIASGFYISLNNTIESTDIKTTSSGTSPSIESLLSILNQDTTYYVFAYATNEFGEFYSQSTEFKTLTNTDIKPTLAEPQIINITSTSFKYSTEYTLQPSYSCTSYGIKIYNETNPDVGTLIYDMASGSNFWNTNTNGNLAINYLKYDIDLVTSNEYNVKAFAVIEGKTFYSDSSKTFKIEDIDPTPIFGDLTIIPEENGGLTNMSVTLKPNTSITESYMEIYSDSALDSQNLIYNIKLLIDSPNISDLSVPYAPGVQTSYARIKFTIIDHNKENSDPDHIKYYYTDTVEYTRIQ